MSDTISVELEIINERGLHARAAASFDVQVERLGQVVDGNSIMGLMMLAAAKGTKIKVSAAGTDAETAIANITQLVNGRFGEDR